MFAECPLDDTRQRRDVPSDYNRRDTWCDVCRVPAFAECIFLSLPSAIICRVYILEFAEYLIICRVLSCGTRRRGSFAECATKCTRQRIGHSANLQIPVVITFRIHIFCVYLNMNKNRI